MDRYEYRLKTEQIQKLVAKKEYKTALQVVESMDWRKVRDVSTLSAAAEVYVAARRYGEAMDLLEQAYGYAPIGRRVIYRLTEVALLAKDAETARAYLDEFKEVAGKDSAQYILEYRLAKLTEQPREQRIALLEAYRDLEMEDRWSYELAKLYAEAGRIDECVALCDEIALWFKQSKYTDRALALKGKYAPLTQEQQERMEHPERYLAKKPGKKAERKRPETKAEVSVEPETASGGREPALREVPEELFVESEPQPGPGDFAEPEPQPESADVAEPEEDMVEETIEAPEPDVQEEMPERHKSAHRLRIPGLSWLFRGTEAEDEDEDPEEQEAVEPEAEAVKAEGPEEETAEPVLFQETEEPENTGTEDDTEWITEMLEANLQEEVEHFSGEESVQLVQSENMPSEDFQPIEDQQKEEEASTPEEETTEPEKADAEWETTADDSGEASAQEKQEEPVGWEESLAQLLQDPTVKSAAETGDVFSATIRQAEEPETISEETDLMEGQLEFDFLRLDAVAKAKEEREKELGIWDDPFRELVMQEPEEEAQIRLIFSSTEEELARSAEDMWKAPVEGPEEASNPEAEAVQQAEVETEEVFVEEPRIIDMQPEQDFREETEAGEGVDARMETEPREAGDSQEVVSSQEEAEAEKNAETEDAAGDPETAGVDQEAAEPQTGTEGQEAAETQMEAEDQEAAETQMEAEADSQEKEEAEGAVPVPETAAQAETAAAQASETGEEPQIQMMYAGSQPIDEAEQALLMAEAAVHRALAEDEKEAREGAKVQSLTITETEPEAEPEERPVEPDPEPEHKSAIPWTRHNMLVRTANMQAGMELAMGYLLRLPPQERPKSVAKTSGEKLNRKTWEELEPRLKGRVLIVEQANAMDSNCMDGLKHYLTGEGHMAVLIDTEEGIAEIGLRNKALLDMFPTEYAYYEYTSDEIVQHGLTYAESQGWTLDDMATLAFYAAVENMPDVPAGRELIEAENIIDDAIELAEQKSLGRILKGAFGNKKEKGNVLKESHFKAH